MRSPPTRERTGLFGWLLRLLGVLLMLSALVMAVSRAPDRSVESLVARWAPAPSDFIDVRGQIVHIRDEGPRNDPQPIVLLHGTAASLHTWEGWVRGLKGQRRVITFDLPGFGLTGPFSGQYTPDDYRGDSYARFVLDVFDTLRLPPVVLGGNSLGGEIAWRTATLAPERVARLLLVDASGPHFTPEAVPAGFVAMGLPGVRWLARHVLPRELVAQGVTSVYGDPTRVTAALVDRYFELMLREGNRQAMSQRLMQLQMGADDARLATVRQPTLILWGERDRLIPPAVGRQFEQQIKGSRLVLLPGLGHVPQEEDPARSLAAVKEFLAPGLADK